MFLPLIVAIFLGLAAPTAKCSNPNGGGTVYVNSTDPDDPGDEPGDPGDGDDDGPGTGGEMGDNPPKP